MAALLDWPIIGFFLMCIGIKRNVVIFEKKEAKLQSATRACLVIISFR